MKKIQVLIFALILAVGGVTICNIKPQANPSNYLYVDQMTDTELAQQMLFLSATGNDKTRINKLTKLGVGGIALFAPISKNIGKYIKNANNLLPGTKQDTPGITPFIASDEEGGLVNRFNKLLGALPPEAKIATKKNSTIKNITYKYGKGLKKYQVNTVFGPVVDRGIKNHYMKDEYRTFSSKTSTIYSKASAWISGYKKAGLITTAKHFPGMGYAGNTHNKITTVKSFSYLKKHDIKPFKQLLKNKKVPMVMVAHEKVPGLTEKGLPASLSKKTYAYLRKLAGNSPVLITDSLSMGAITSSLKLTITQAVIKALASGADSALVVSGSDPAKLIKNVAKAIKNGTIPREQAIKSVKRILKLKQKYGIVNQGLIIS